MSCLEVNFCKSIKINKLNFCIKSKSKLNEEEFKLIKSKHRKYKKLVPSNNEYMFLKVLDNGMIISAVGELLKFFQLKTKDLVNKYISDLEKCQVFFDDFICPLFYSCLENKTAYQFDFEIKNKKFSCSLYPCPIPEEILSIDIVIRPSTNHISDKNTDSFVLN